MGSLGSYNAQVYLGTKRTLKLDKPNSDEQINEFLSKKGGNFYEEVKLKETPEDDKDILNGKYSDYIFYDEDDDEVKLSDYDDFDGFIDIANDYNSELYGLKEVKKEDLCYLNLDILEKYNCLPKNVDIVELLGSIENCIYCNTDNSSSSKISLTKEQLEDIAKGVSYLKLEGDGWGEHC